MFKSTFTVRNIKSLILWLFWKIFSVWFYIIASWTFCLCQSFCFLFFILILFTMFHVIVLVWLFLRTFLKLLTHQHRINYQIFYILHAYNNTYTYVVGSFPVYILWSGSDRILFLSFVFLRFPTICCALWLLYIYKEQGWMYHPYETQCDRNCAIVKLN